ncbi:M23 family metallopeptidase [Enemella evansiae]|uniref:M23 family metallopeptidase n=1 Tax=Enemella evansiae TaxID=2016499 RepID=UPI000B973CA8|nr:M23 family metallopeptidase [Enemella evansiae]OYN95584.1 hypothetical protein CGZ95_17945 [Enemella evansiae]OYO10290.1 hypothetical protein BI335_17260 [Enemella evansiae]TDO87720.1 murein DD-endopeptidase MepM/ murein hydrolase activator NlpD [Enemella evansiae]
MSQRSFRRAKARRALGVESQEDALAANRSTIDEDLSIRGLVTHGLAALAISALGLAVAGSVAMTSSAQAVETATSATAATGQDQTQAQPAPVAAQQQQPAAVNDPKPNTQQNDESVDGALDVFARQADGTSRNAVRAAIDGAVADQKAKERGDQLVATGEQASEASGNAIADARSTNLVNNQQATKREQARLAEEKKKAEEALKKKQEADAASANAASGTGAGSLEAPAPAAAPAPAPQVGGGDAGVSGGGGAKPIASGYTLGARWGAVGSWSRYHTGQDLPAPIGTPIRAASGGVVLAPNGGGWAGTHVVIKHADGSATLYAHMSTSLVRPGQMVQAGQQIGAVGMTGRTFGPHLHFEHYPGGVVGNPYVTDDPYSWMLRLGVRL